MHKNIYYSWASNFYRLFIGQGLASIISETVNYSLLFYLTSISKPATILSISEIISLLPIALFAPFAGVMADRVSKKKILIFSDTISLIVTLLLFLQAINSHNNLTIDLILISNLLRSTTISIQNPTIQSAVPELVPDDKLLKINGQYSSLQALNQFFPSILGGILYGLLSVDYILLLSGLANVIGICAVIITCFPRNEVNNANQRGFHLLFELKQGLHSIIQVTGLNRVIIYKAFSVAIIVPSTALYPLMTSEHFHGSLKFDAPLVEVSIALGMALSGLCMGNLNNLSHRLTPAGIGVLGIGLSLFISGILPGNHYGFIIFIIINFIAGLCIPWIDAPAQTLLQDKIEHKNLGKVISFYLMMIGLAGPAGLSLSSVISKFMSTAEIFIGSGILLILMLLVALFDRKLRSI